MTNYEGSGEPRELMEKHRKLTARSNAFPTFIYKSKEEPVKSHRIYGKWYKELWFWIQELFI